MNKKQVIIGVAILSLVGIGTWLVLREFKMLANYCFKFWKVQIVSLNVKNIDLLLSFIIKNNSNTNIDISNQQYQIYINEHKISDVVSPELIQLPAHGYGIAKINVAFNPLQVLNIGLTNVAQLLGDRSAIKVAIQGYATAGSGGLMLRKIPISYTTNLKELTTTTTNQDPNKIAC